MIRVSFSPSIYIWISIQEEIMYVGETNNYLGILGRAYQHIQEGGTLYNNVEKMIGMCIYNIKDLRLLNFPLPENKKFTSRCSIYREAVEYLVQKFIIENREKLKVQFRLISNVKSNDMVNKSYVISIAEDIFSEMILKINNL